MGAVALGAQPLARRHDGRIGLVAASAEGAKASRGAPTPFRFLMRGQAKNDDTLLVGLGASKLHCPAPEWRRMRQSMMVCRMTEVTKSRPKASCASKALTLAETIAALSAPTAQEATKAPAADPAAPKTDVLRKNTEAIALNGNPSAKSR